MWLSRIRSRRCRVATALLVVLGLLFQVGVVAACQSHDIGHVTGVDHHHDNADHASDRAHDDAPGSHDFFHTSHGMVHAPVLVATPSVDVVPGPARAWAIRSGHMTPAAMPASLWRPPISG